MSRALVYQRLAESALRRGDRASAAIYARQAREAEPLRHDAPADGGRFVGDGDDFEFHPAPAPRPAQPLRHGRQQPQSVRRPAPGPWRYGQRPRENAHAARLEAIVRLMLGARTEAELERARRQAQAIAGMSDDEVQALA